MIAFASLFLGLVLGPQSVELVVGEGVAAVELRLDGESQGTVREAPWVLDCDLGDELAPQKLEAIALDAAGRELARVSQWLNLPTPPVVLNAVLEPRTAGEPRVARLSWESTAGAEPESVSASLDGQSLAVPDPRRIVLPQVDESQLHLLQVEMRFEGRKTSRLDMTFGGAYADEVSTEITALAIVSTGNSSRPPTLAGVQDWFVKDGESLRVIALEKEVAEIVVVMGRPFPRFFAPGEPVKIPKGLRLAGDQQVRFIATTAEASQGVSRSFNLFPISPAYDREVGNLYELLSHILRPPEKQKPRVGAAVAVAGLAAFEGRHRRAVVLVPSPVPDSEDDLEPGQVRRYLERLRVPLAVWDPESRSAEHVRAWGEVTPVGSVKELDTAFAALSQELDRQWIVWLDGRHLPQDVELSSKAEGFALP